MEGILMVWVTQGKIGGNTTGTIMIPANANFRRMRLTTDNTVYVSMPALLMYITNTRNISSHTENRILVNGELDIKFRERVDGRQIEVLIINNNTSNVNIQLILDE